MSRFNRVLRAGVILTVSALSPCRAARSRQRRSLPFPATPKMLSRWSRGYSQYPAPRAVVLVIAMAPETFCMHFRAVPKLRDIHATHGGLIIDPAGYCTLQLSCLDHCYCALSAFLLFFSFSSDFCFFSLTPSTCLGVRVSVFFWMRRRTYCSSV